MNKAMPFAAMPVSGRSVLSVPEVHMPEQTFEQFVKKERDRLSRSRKDALAKRAEIDANIASIDTELAAIEAYEAAKLGKKPGGRRSGTRRTGRRDEVLAAVRKHQGGVTRGELIASLGATDASDQSSITNALAALKRNGKLTHDPETKKYQIA